MKDLFAQLAKIEGQQGWVLPTRNVIGYGSEEDVFEALVQARPIRFIRVSEQSALGFSISERCYKVGGEVICSEYISISGPWHDVSLSLRALLFPGIKTLALMLERSRGFIDEVAPLCDTLIIDSEQTKDIPEGNIVDLNWIRLTPIREEIRYLFDMAKSHDSSSKIIGAKVYGDKGWLIAGWIFSKLGLEPESGKGIKGGAHVRAGTFNLELIIKDTDRIELEFQGKDAKIGVLSVCEGIIKLEYADEVRKRVFPKKSQRDLCLEYDTFGAPTSSYKESVRIGREILEYAS
jgi:glucose-6-phosphate dehydrogenase assembly protein OpcA